METKSEQDEFYLLHTVPTVLRARGFRLYTRGGKRLLDLWQNNGSAVLGHTPPNLLRELKNTASRGLYAPLPHFLEGRFIKALLRLFPNRSFKLYAAAPAALEPLLKSGEAALWRPFLDPASPFAATENAPPILVPVLPGIQGWRGNLPLGLCVLAISPDFQCGLPAADILSPVLLAAAARSIHDLLASPQRVRPNFPRIAKALKNSPWQRQGIYLNLREKPDAGQWALLFSNFLDAGFLLPPVSYHPLILPGELSDGEESKLAGILGKIQ
ncbi:MAG: hypothetical protein FWG99_09470 [Treponema sp.]|nr:hypothetical protein [Treponema sp.]